MNVRYDLIIATILVACPLVARSSEPEGGPLSEPFKQSELHTTWRNLGNEQVMFPLDMQDMPVKIGSERQLFLDNYLIAKSRAVTRQVHHPRRHQGNPILTPRKLGQDAWSSGRVCVFHVRQFQTSPRFRMWYWSWSRWHPLSSGQQVRFATSYAVSEDGVQWKMPNLDLYKIQGMADRNLVLPYGLMHGLFYEPDEPDPQKRFKAMVCVEGKDPEIPEGYYLHTSPDGIHWKADLSRYLIPSGTSYNLPQNGLHDTSRFWWDPLREKYIADAKFVLPGSIRCRGIMQSDDLIHWTRPHPTFFARAAGSEIYGHTGFVYQGMYIGARWIYVHAYNPRTHSMHVELDCSRDGNIWTRVAAGQQFMAFNPKRDTWDASRIKPTTLLEVGDEIWIYYTAAPTGLESQNPKFPAAHRVPYSVGLAMLKRDRFASINAGDQPGTLLTRPLNFQGKQLHINAQVSKGDRLRIAVVDRDGRPIPGYESRSCNPLEGDSIDMPVSWKDKSNLAGLTRSAVRLRFELHNAKLFSFWIE